MTVHNSRLVGFVATGALVAGLGLVPLATTASAADPAGPDGPAFYRIDAESTGSGAAVTATAARTAAAPAATAKATVKKSKGEQILQSIVGIQGVGSNGLAVAAGPKQVIQLGGPAARAYTKRTGKQAAARTTNQFFNVDTSFVLSQPTVVYDPLGKRFVAVAVADDAGDVGMVMRISKGTAATPFTSKKWRKPIQFAFSDDPAEQNPDVDESKPAIGISGDKIAVTVAAYDPSDPSIVNRVFFMAKNSFYGGNLSSGVWTADLNNTYSGQAPAVNQTNQNNLFIAIPDTADVAVTTYTGAASSKAPVFSQNIVYPTTNLTVPPQVVQSGGDTLDLGGLAFSGVAWRSNKLWAAATVDCGGDACVRVFGISTASGVTLSADKTLKSSGRDWFSPALAIDGANNVHLAATDVGSATGPSQAIFVRNGTSWTSPRFIRKGNANADVPPAGVSTADWWMSNSAATDPTSPWDVWVAGASGDSGVAPTGLTTRVARVSLAKNVATIKTSATRVKKGKKVTFTVKLARPGGNTLRGLPVALQRKPVSGGKWSNVRTGKTAANGTVRWSVKVKRAGLYRTLGQKVSQQNGQGRVIDKVTSASKRVRVR